MIDEAEDQLMEVEGSDEEFRQMLSRASQDEEYARSARERMTYKRSPTAKELSASMFLEIPLWQCKECRVSGTA